MQLDQSFARQCVDLLAAAADRLEKVSDSLTLPSTFLMQRELEKSDQIEVVLQQEAFLYLHKAHALYLGQPSRAVPVNFDAKNLEVVLQLVLFIAIFNLLTPFRILAIVDIPVNLKFVVQSDSLFVHEARIGAKLLT